jgi:hypothetical protein
MSANLKCPSLTWNKDLVPIINKAAMNIVEHVSVVYTKFLFLGSITYQFNVSYHMSISNKINFWNKINNWQ